MLPKVYVCRWTFNRTADMVMAGSERNLDEINTKIALIWGFLLFFVPSGWAHQPRLVGTETDVVVTLPEISKAYYGRLAGTPVIYHIEADDTFRLYANILVPDIEGIDKDVSVKILKQGSVIAHLDGSRHDWQGFFEPFAGDHYFRGPEYSERQGPGSYQLQVYSPDNQGKYVLAIGDVESFPFTELVKTYYVLPRLKSEFFGKSPFTAYSNRMGIFLAVLLLILLLFAVVLYLGIRRVRKRLKNKTEVKGKGPAKN